MSFGLFACLVIASGSQNLPRPWAYGDAVDLPAVSDEFVSFEADESLDRIIMQHNLRV